MTQTKVFDCIIIGAGPGGLQAAIYLGRYNRDVLLLDRGGGRTWHARHIENFLTQKAISGPEIIRTGMEQARHFNVAIEKGEVVRVAKNIDFEVHTKETTFFAKFVIVSTGATDNLPPIENVYKFLGTSFFTCVDCDGYRTTGKKLAVIGNSLKTVHLAFAMKEMFTRDLTLILYFLAPPEEYAEILREEDIPFIIGRPAKIIGEEKIEAIEFQDGRRIGCEVIMSNFGYKLNDAFLAGLGLKRDREQFKYVTNSTYESSLTGLYILGPLTGNDQAVIAAGEGAGAAIDIKKRLLEYLL
jgi:thioredoxin reductase (NADPH)